MALDALDEHLADGHAPHTGRHPMAARKEKVDVRPKLLSGGYPQIPKGEGAGPVRDDIAAMPGWKRDVGERLDALIVGTVPDVQRRSNGVNRSTASRARLVPDLPLLHQVPTAAVPQRDIARSHAPKASKHDEVRYLDIHEDDELDEDQLRSWSDQASKLPGEKM